jgi:putative ABC transport system permease protein
MGDQRFKIVGVYQDPKRLVAFYDVTNGPLRPAEDFFIPLQTAVRLELETFGNTNCWKSYEGGFSAKLASECVWLQHWVELPNAAAIADFKQFMAQHAAQQKALGRFPRTATNNLLADVNTHMEIRDVVSDDQRMASWVGVGFLLVAVVNATCLLLAKFLRGSHTAAVHRSLGAARSDIFRLHLVEAMILGAMSAALGLAFTWLAMAAMRWAQSNLENIAVMDYALISKLTAVSLLASLLAASLPAWRVSRLPPAASLRMN